MDNLIINLMAFFQTDAAKSMGGMLVPLNVAASGLIYWRVQKVEEQIRELDKRIYELHGER